MLTLVWGAFEVQQEHNTLSSKPSQTGGLAYDNLQWNIIDKCICAFKCDN